ncbi:hypothetical protein GCM10009636_17430 [Arthrobacter koreensis]
MARPMPRFPPVTRTLRPAWDWESFCTRNPYVWVRGISSDPIGAEGNYKFPGSSETMGKPVWRVITK